MTGIVHKATWLPACLLVLVTCALFASSGCGMVGQGLVEPTPTGTSLGSQFPAEFLVPPSLDEQIFISKVIVRASLKSVSPKAETVPSKDEGVAPTYRPVQELRFTVHEYLKGSGPSELLVVARDDHTYVKSADALKAAKKTVDERVTTWDDRQAVLFLGDPWGKPYPADGASGSSATPALQFAHSSMQLSRFDYSLDTLSRSWLPASATTTGAQAAGAGSATFISSGPADGGGENPWPTIPVVGGVKSAIANTNPWPAAISLAELKAAIAKMAATLKAGEGIDGYETCIWRRLTRGRIERSDKLTGYTFVPARFEKTLASGMATGTEAFSKRYLGKGYNHHWLSGPSAAHFQVILDDDDSDPRNGYDFRLYAARPLPSGVYIVRQNNQHYNKIPCDFKPLNAYKVITTTVTAPAGTVHEAFFDPIYATSTGEYKADASLGVLSPAAYRKAGANATTTISSIVWKSQQVKLTVGPLPLPPKNHHLDFIALDGSVKLRLDVEDATRGETVGAYSYTWGVCAQPWKAGDLLMLRIAQSPANLTGATNDTSCATPTPVATSTPGPLSQSTSSGTPQPEPPVSVESSAPQRYEGPTSTDEMIVLADTIVRARLSTTTAAVESIDPALRVYDYKYRTVLEFRFQILEYLKGSGASEIVALGLGDVSYETETAASSSLSALLASHDTRWDGRDAVIFLWDEYEHAPSTKKAGRYYLGWLDGGHGTDGYTVASVSYKAWLPKADAAESSVSASSGDEQRFLLDAPENQGQFVSTLQNDAYSASASTGPPTIKLVDLKKRIAGLKAEVDAGDGSEAYRDCVSAKYYHERSIRWRTSTEGAGAWRTDKVTSSGLPAGSVMYEDNSSTGDPPDKTGKYWLEGGDKHLFSVGTYDFTPLHWPELGMSNRIRYTVRVTTTRPLPGGAYEYYLNGMSLGRLLCNAYSELERNLAHTVITVTAPAGTLHEAFFDPIYATSTGEYKADASLGTLKPAAYRKAGANATTTISSIAWKAQQVKLTVGPLPLPPENHHLDFIALDGTVKLWLDVEDATRGETVGAYSYTWGVCAQPWKAGDLLMLRISKSPANLTGATNDTSCATH